MKVLYITYPQVSPNPGGLQIQVMRTAAELNKLGVDVIRFNPWQNQIDQIDMIHIFGTAGFCLSYTYRALELNKKVIISPVFNSFEDKEWRLALKLKLSSFIPGMLTDLKKAAIMLQTSTRVLALNQQERNILLKNFKVERARCIIVPNGIDKKFLSGDPKLFEKKYGIHDFVLCVGSIEHRKNQLTLIRAMNELAHPLVLVGEGPSTNDSYLKQCRTAAGDNVIFTGHLAHDDPMLQSVFASARLFVLPSYSEVMPLTLYEAALSKCKLIASRNFPIAEQIHKYVPRFDPNDSKELAEMIKREMVTQLDPKIKLKVLDMESWVDVCHSIKDVYEAVIEESKTS